MKISLLIALFLSLAFMAQSSSSNHKNRILRRFQLRPISDKRKLTRISPGGKARVGISPTALYS
jgi:hypothetical protein